MKFFISTTPFFDADMSVQAYRIVTQDGSNLLGASEGFRMFSAELQTPALDIVEQVGVEPFVGECDIFIDIGKYPLLMGKPADTDLPWHKTVCVIDKSLVTSVEIWEKLVWLHKIGYRLALDGVPETLGLDIPPDIFSYIILDCNSASFARDLCVAVRYTDILIPVITGIPHQHIFEKFIKLSDALFTGAFFREPITKGKVSISPLKINMLHLLKQLNSLDFDLITIATTIERDLALSVSLLRFLNFINPNRSNKIGSIRKAVAILGQKEVKKWAMVAISISIGADRPNEIIRLSLLRAKFAENLAPAYGLSNRSGSLFIMGLFSLIDVILQIPMKKAVQEVAVEKDIVNALCNDKGPFYDIMKIVRAYERADFDTSSILMVKNGLDIEVLSKSYLDALLWYRELLDSIEAEEIDVDDE